MGKALIIAEKPSVAADIAEALGGFSKTSGGVFESSTAVISCALGHLVQLVVPEADGAGFDLSSLPVIPARFGLEAIPENKAQFALVSRLMNRSDIDHVVNACDAGREGELIFRLTYELAGCRKPMSRMWLQSMTQDAIRKAHQGMRPGREFDGLSDAARCRGEADWIVGINGSRGVSRLLERESGARENASAGRVQTPTLAIVVHLEQKIRTFVPESYWEVHATFQAEAGVYRGRWIDPRQAEEPEEDAPARAVNGRFFDHARAEEVAARCRGVAPSSVEDKSVPTKSFPPKLFDLTTLQREANKRFKFSAKRTLDIAQALYEKHKVTSYPRTDSNALPEDYVEKAAEILGAFGRTPIAAHAERVLSNGWVKPDKRIFDDSKISDHFAIIPTGVMPRELDNDERRIFDLVARRFVAIFHPAAEYLVTKRTTVVAGETFRSSGKVLTARGWLEVYGSDAGGEEASRLCAVKPGEAVQAHGMTVEGLQTKAPSRLTEGTLLAAMEGAGKLVDDDELREAMKERGLGTPATRAATIEGLLADRDGKKRPKTPYMIRQGEEQFLVPTDKAFRLIGFLDANNIEVLTSPRLTGEWERKLREIERGKMSRSAFMAEISVLTTDLIDVIRRRAGESGAVNRSELGIACPRCRAPMLRAPKAFECSGQCSLRIGAEICGRVLSNDEGIALLRDGVAGPFTDFVSAKTKKPFSASLRLDVEQGRAEFEFEPREQGVAANPLAPRLQAACPKCRGAVMDQGRVFKCEKCEFKLWREIAQRPLSTGEAERLISTGMHPPLDGFTSLKGKPFSAALKLSRDRMKVEFEFL